MNAGNLSFDSITNSFRENISELSIPIANRNFIAGDPGGVIGYQSGTSMAAPKVSHLAGLIQLYNPDFSANLIRALIINSAEWPPDLFNQMPHPFGTEVGNEIKLKMLQLCGYGVPKIEKALAANQHCIILFSEGVFEWDLAEENDLTSNGRYASKVSFFRATFDHRDLAAPDILGERVRISITLAYNPFVRKTNNRYQAVEMYWDLKREEESIENFESRLMQVSDPYNTPSDDRAWFLKPVLNQGIMKRRGTVIKDWFDTELGRIPVDLEVAVSATVSDWYKPPRALSQKFALVVSIESLNKDVAIYDRIRVRTQIPIQT